VSELPPVPEYPTKEMFTKKYEPTPGQKEFQTKDFQKSKVPYFDEVAYNKAMEEYQNAENERSELENELRDESASWKFLNECYRKLPKIG
jgi:FMN-dependent NADH-azoreductase